MQKNLSDFAPFTIIDNNYGAGSGKVILSFDDGPNPHHDVTERLLDILQRKGVRATFCYIGKYVEATPGLALASANQGHLIANHSQTHDYRMFVNGYTSEIMQSDLAIRNATGKTPEYYRPPMGIRYPHKQDKTGVKGLAKISFFYNDAHAGPVDFHRPLERIISRLVACNGGAIVLHERHADFLGREPSPENLSNPRSKHNKSWLPDALDQLVENISRAGLDFTDYENGF